MGYVMPNAQEYFLKEIAQQMRITNTMIMLRELFDTDVISYEEYCDELQKLKPSI